MVAHGGRGMSLSKRPLPVLYSFVTLTVYNTEQLNVVRGLKYKDLSLLHPQATTLIKSLCSLIIKDRKMKQSQVHHVKM